MEIQRRIQYRVAFEKLDSHIEQKLKEDPGRKLKGNELAWRLNEEADQLAGIARVSGEKDDEVFYEEAQVMVEYKGRFIYGSFVVA